MGCLARFYKGGLTIPNQKKMTWFEVEEWQNIYILQSSEEEIVTELSYDDKGNKKKLPPYDVIREMTLDRIEQRKVETEERRNELDGQ